MSAQALGRVRRPKKRAADLISRMRLTAEDLHVIHPASETVKCLSLGADEIERLQTELAAAQAREAQLREALKKPNHGMEFIEVFRILDEAIHLSHDDAALKVRLAAERERCAKVCEIDHPHTFARLVADHIRNLGDE